MVGDARPGFCLSENHADLAEGEFAEDAQLEHLAVGFFQRVQRRVDPFLSAADHTVLEKDMVLVLSLGARYHTGVSELYITKDTLFITEDGCKIVGWYENWDYPYTAAYTF